MELASSPSVSKPAPPAPHTNWLMRRDASDWLFAFAVVVGTGIAVFRYGYLMDGYDVAILILHAPLLIAAGWAWRPFRLFVTIVAMLALFSIWLYQGNLARAELTFFLKYLISSQSAITWMSVFFFTATGAYWLGFASRSDFAERTGSAMTWIAVIMGTTGLFVRWHESYLIGSGSGHIPISNLYEALILFILATALLYLFYEGRYGTRKLGAFVLPIVSVAIIFMLWYSKGGAYQIQSLPAALQTYWKKIHVPANFIGYGGFAIAAMAGIAYLLSLRGKLADRLPEPRMLEDVMYRAIAIGFAFFTIATILGALWAAEAWGSYWQWDPKETWALIVWINYAVWLHMRLTRSLRGEMLAWWAVVGLFIVTFAFVGVNMFLSGLHSYGTPADPASG
ncbi:MAG: c-type cytochrome biogenesis protein CcsB [Betaproteobacteria bacterium]|nr:c-type cytochrome biogenesis protein CcsB [Betaproteobacteria bacterium]